MALTPTEIPAAQRKLVAWWAFDETEGSVLGDSSGNRHGGTLVGNPQWQPDGGKTGGALAFDGVDDYIDCGSNEDLNFTEAISVAAWIKLAGPAKDQKIVSNQDNVCGGYKVSIYDNKLELEIRDSANSATQNRYVEGGTVLEPGVWYHVAATYCQGGSIKTYVNAKLDRELPTPSILAPSAGTLKIGREPFGDMYWLNGLLDDLQIYNYPLSQIQVAALYSGQAPPTIAQIEIVDASEPKKKTSGNWIPVSIIVIIAVVIGVAAVRKKKTV